MGFGGVGLSLGPARLCLRPRVWLLRLSSEPLRELEESRLRLFLREAVSLWDWMNVHSGELRPGSIGSFIINIVAVPRDAYSSGSVFQ